MISDGFQRNKIQSKNITSYRFTGINIEYVNFLRTSRCFTHCFPEDHSLMPEKSYIIWLNETVFIFVYFITEKGNVGQFVAKLNIIRNGKYIEIARYDSGFHEPHLDIMGPNGDKKRIIDYSTLENDQALTVAIQDFKNNWSVLHRKVE